MTRGVFVHPTCNVILPLVMSFNAMVLQMEESDHLPKWDGASVLRECASSQLRRAVEAAFFRLEETSNMKHETRFLYTIKIYCQNGITSIG